MHNPTSVLFVCDGGSVRSRMAEGLLRSLGGEDFEVYSAGIEAEDLNIQAVEIMREIDIVIDNSPIQSLNDFEDIQFDYVITLCEQAKESCIAFPRDSHNVHWECSDPSAEKGDIEKQRTAYRLARDELKHKVSEWLEALQKH